MESIFKCFAHVCANGVYWLENSVSNLSRSCSLKKKHFIKEVIIQYNSALVRIVFQLENRRTIKEVMPINFPHSFAFIEVQRCCCCCRLSSLPVEHSMLNVPLKLQTPCSFPAFFHTIKRPMLLVAIWSFISLSSKQRMNFCSVILEQNILSIVCMLCFLEVWYFIYYVILLMNRELGMSLWKSTEQYSNSHNKSRIEMKRSDVNPKIFFNVFYNFF